MATIIQRMFVAICLAAALAAMVPVASPVSAQPKPPVVPGPVPQPQPQPQPTPVGSASFRNDLTTPVIIQGVTRLPNKIQRGAPIIIAPGKTVTEFNVPAGIREYVICDGNAPQVVLVRGVQVGVLPGRPTGRVIRQLPNNQIIVAPQ